jgi:hypothetical protein
MKSWVFGKVREMLWLWSITTKGQFITMVWFSIARLVCRSILYCYMPFNYILHRFESVPERYISDPNHQSAVLLPTLSVQRGKVQCHGGILQ